MPNTVHLHCDIATKPDECIPRTSGTGGNRQLASPYGFLCTGHELNATVGETHKMSFRNFTNSQRHAFGGTYLELVPNERLVYTDKFDDPGMPGEMKVTVTLKAVSVGSEMTPVEGCYLGWQDSLQKLAKLVEPEISE